MSALTNLQGNHACALGAIAAGCRFYAGYPITPSSEIAERMALELPRIDGVFIQMEDEIASMAAVLGASAGGARAMTATSGPGFSLKQENIGYAAAAEIPCVVINVMRGGPSTGMPTRPSQGDIMQTRWGTHGDHPVVVLTPWSVEEVYRETRRAFAIAESLRVPVVVAFDETVGHLVESVDIDAGANDAVAARKPASGDPATFQPFATTDDLVPPMARPGDGYRTHTTGLTHGEDGFPTQNPEAAHRALDRLLRKLEMHRDRITRFDSIDCEDAEVVIVAIGITARAAAAAVDALRRDGVRAGLFRPVTLWPFPEHEFADAVAAARQVLVPEMNAGQLVLEVERLAPAGVRVDRLCRYDGEAIAPAQIINRVRELAHDS